MSQMDPVNTSKTSKYPAPLYVSDIEACPDRASFLQLVMPYYQASCKEFGIRWPGVCALQCIYETGVPTNIANSLRQNNNMGGLKGTTLPGASVGSISTEGDHYAKFASVDKYIYAAMYNIANSGYYTKAMSATTMQDFALFLIRMWVNGSDNGGDAYAWDVIADYDKYGLSSYENDGSGSVTGGGGAASGSAGSNGTDLSNMTFDTSVRERETARTEEGTHPELKTFYRINMTGAQFIRQVLAPYCKSKESGQGAYRLWFDDEASPDGTPGVKLYFKPDQYVQIEDKMAERLLPDVDRTYEFSYGSGPESSVISFNPNYAGIVTSVIGGYEVEAATTDAITNDLFSLKYNRFTDPNRPSTGDSVFDDLQGTVRIGASSYTYDEVANRAANLWYNMAQYGYTADMTVIGDPMIDVQKLCSVAVYTPQGLPHYSSGVYLITHVTDSISGGSFTSAMNMVRNAISIGTNDSGGVDITLGATDTRYIGDAANMFGGGTSGSSGSSGTSATSGNSSTDLKEPLTQGQSTSIPDGLGTYYTVTGYGSGGIHYANGRTTPWASGTNQRTVWDKWVAAGSVYTDHIATLNGKWLIACTNTFGNVGDYIKFTLGNGQVLDCIMADEKNQSDAGCTKWGHDNGKCVIEFEVDIDYFNQVGNPGTGSWKSEWSGTTVTSATNLGPAI